MITLKNKVSVLLGVSFRKALKKLVKGIKSESNGCKKVLKKKKQMKKQRTGHGDVTEDVGRETSAHCRPVE